MILKRIAELHPFTLAIAEYLLNFDLFLPHDKDYYGFNLIKKEKGLFLDVGADDGRSIRSFRKLKRNWKIFAIEANPINIPKLKKTKVDFIIKAASNESNKSLTLYTPAYHSFKIHTGSSTSLEFSKKSMEKFKGIRYKKTTVQTIKIDDLNLLPDIIKMDIEGGELNALKGCTETIKKCSPVFLIEVNEYFEK